MLRLTILALATMVGWLPQLPRDRPTMPEAIAAGVVAGRVTIDVNGAPQPVRRARITLEGDVLTRPLRTDTDTQGRYRFDKLPPGSYRIRAEKAGVVPYVRDPRRAFQRPDAFDVGAGQTLALDLLMVRGAALDGRVLKDNGDPAVNIVVSAMRFSYDASGRRGAVIRQARTDDRGRFRVHSLPAGEYYLEAAADPLDVLRQAPSPDGRVTMLARSFYPGAPRMDGGQSIPLAAGQEMVNLEFSVSTVPATAVRGTIIDSTGAPARSMSARIQRVGEASGEVRGSINPRSNDFSFPQVPSGEFWVMGITRPSPAADPEFAVARMTVNGEPLREIALTTAKGAAVHGQVETEAGSAPLPASLHVIAPETEFEVPSLTEAPAGPPPGAVAANGTFTLKSLFGPRLLRFDKLPAGWALKNVWVDGVDVTDLPVDFRGRDTARTVRMVITSRTAAVSGVVSHEGGQPAGRARVVVFSADDKAWGWRSRMVKSVETDDHGRYAIDGLLDAEYRIIAVPFLDDGAWMDSTILARLLPSASPLVVRNATNLTANLVVKP
jgi:hypothetical protein